MRVINSSIAHSLFQIKEKEIEELYNSWKKALMTNDFQILENLYSDNFTSANSAGIIKNKSEVLTRLRFKDIRYLFWEDKNVLIDIKGKDAILKSRQTLDIELYSLSIKIDREIILTFENQNGKWFLRNIMEI